MNVPGNIVVYGIPNCDTVRKARAWLTERGIDYAFHDYKKAGIDPAKLRGWVNARGWETVLNRKGPTFRKLPDASRADLDEDKAVKLMTQHTSAIKRPMVELPGGLLVGFDPEQWSAALAGGR